MSSLLDFFKRTPAKSGGTRKLNTGSIGTGELDQLVSNRTGIRVGVVRTVRSEYFQTMVEEVDRGTRVNIRGLFTMYASRASARSQRMWDGSYRQIPVRDLPRCKFSDSLKKWMAPPGPSGTR